jgi:predicted nucleic acid-binding protein
LIVLDASMMLAWLLNEPGSVSRPQLRDILRQEALLVPAHWPAEIGNALLMNERRGKISEQDIEIIMTSLDEFSVSTQLPPQAEQFPWLVQIARAFRLTFYDAIYVHLAVTTQSALATLDQDMRNAARELGLILIPE